MRSFSDPLQMEENRNRKRRLYFSENSSTQRYVIIKKTDSEQSFKGVSPFVIEKGLAMITTYIKETQRLRSGDLLVLTNREEGYKALLKANKLAGFPIVAEDHKLLNSCKGVVYSHDLMFVDTDEITKELHNQKVTKVERIKRKINGELKDTPLHILTFDTTELPNEIKAGFLKLEVRLYIPNPMRCHNCNRYGHTKTKCFRVPICPKCAKPIPEGHEEIQCEPIKCSNCHQNHTSFDRNCPTFTMEKEIIKIKTMDRITYYRAKEKYFRENANTTGATMTQQSKLSFSEVLKQNSSNNFNSNNPQNNNNNNNNKINNIINKSNIIDTSNNNNNENNNNNNDKKESNNTNNNNNNNNIKQNNNNNFNNTSNDINSKNKIKPNETERNENQQIKTTTTTEQSTSRSMARKYNFLNPAELRILDDYMDE